MTDTIQLDGVTISKSKLQEIIKQHPELVQKETEGRYFFPEDGDEAWYIDDGSSICRSRQRESYKDKEYISAGVFKTIEQAEKEIARQKAKVRIWKYAQENDMVLDCDWWNGNQEKYYPSYNIVGGKFCISHGKSVKSQFELPYTTKENYYKLIKDCKKDLLIYFGVEN